MKITGRLLCAIMLVVNMAYLWAGQRNSTWYGRLAGRGGAQLVCAAAGMASGVFGLIKTIGAINEQHYAQINNTDMPCLPCVRVSNESTVFPMASSALNGIAIAWASIVVGADSFYYIVTGNRFFSLSFYVPYTVHAAYSKRLPCLLTLEVSTQGRLKEDVGKGDKKQNALPSIEASNLVTVETDDGDGSTAEGAKKKVD